jgi:hypothetical protein
MMQPEFDETQPGAYSPTYNTDAANAAEVDSIIRSLQDGTLNQPLTEEEQKEKTDLIDAIRNHVVVDPEVKLDAQDVLPPFIYSLPLDKIRLIKQNCDRQAGSKNKGIGSTMVLDTICPMTKVFTGDQYTIDSAREDVNLQADIDHLVTQYFGSIPLVGRIVARLSTHFKPISKEPVVINLEQMNVNKT